MSENMRKGRHRIACLEVGGEPHYRRTKDAPVVASVWVASPDQAKADTTDSRGLLFTVTSDGVWTVAVREPGPGFGHPGPRAIASGHVDDTCDPAEVVNPDHVLAVYEANPDREFVRALLAGVAGIAAQAQRDARTAREQLANAYTPEAVKALDANTAASLHGLLSDRLDGDAPVDFADEIRTVLADDAGACWSGDAARVEFPADHYQDGFWYSEAGAVAVLADGTRRPYDFSRTLVADQLTEISGVGRRAGRLDGESRLVVDLNTGAVTHA